MSVKLVRVGKRDYVTEGGRFTVRWSKNQGARSCWRVTDREDGRSLRAFEAREVLRELAGELP